MRRDPIKALFKKVGDDQKWHDWWLFWAGIYLLGAFILFALTIYTA